MFARSNRRPAFQIDEGVTLGSVHIPQPIMNAAGTAGLSTELGSYLDLCELGAFVTKSLAVFPWEGNAAPRVASSPISMINSVGLAGPGVDGWLLEHRPRLLDRGVRRIVVSVWGRNIGDYGAAVSALERCGEELVAVELNLSCPNLDGGSHLFAHDPAEAAEVVRSCTGFGHPLWAKLSPNTDRLVEVAGAVYAAGAEAVVVANTMMGMMIDLASRRPVLGAGGGGVSGRAIHPIAVRAVYDCHRRYPSLPIIGVGGVASGEDAVEMLLAGASAVQVGTASFEDPRACEVVRSEMLDWCAKHQVRSVSSLIGDAHDS